VEMASRTRRKLQISRRPQHIVAYTRNTAGQVWEFVPTFMVVRSDSYDV
jgi:hypothetical protein